MTIKELINRELFATAQKALKGQNTNAKDDFLSFLKSADLSDANQLQQILEKDYVKENRFLNLVFVKQVELLILDSKGDYNEVLKKIKDKELNFGIDKLLWIKNKLLYFKNEEYLDFKYSEFLKKVFSDEFSEFVKDNELFNELGIIIKPRSYNWNKDIFLNVFESASKQFSSNTKIRWIAGRINFMDENYDAALEYVTSIYNDYKNKQWKYRFYDTDSIEFTYYDFIDIVQTLAIISSLKGDCEKACEYAEKVLNNLPLFRFPAIMQRLYEKIHFMDSYFVRMRCNMLRNNHKRVLEDYEKVKDVFEISDWKEWYADVLEYIELKRKDN
jgi:hypothetical protein